MPSQGGRYDYIRLPCAPSPFYIHNRQQKEMEYGRRKALKVKYKGSTEKKKKNEDHQIGLVIQFTRLRLMQFAGF